MRLIIILTLTVLIIANGLGWYVNLHNQRHNCMRAEKIALRIRQAELQQLHTIGKPGSAGYKYYLQNPDELAKVKSQLRRYAETFRPEDCTGFFG